MNSSVVCIKRLSHIHRIALFPCEFLKSMLSLILSTSNGKTLLRHDLRCDFLYEKLNTLFEK